MRPIPQKLRQQIDEDPYYRICARSAEGECDGRVTMEHAFIYSGRQINELWAIVPLCWYHHLGARMDKRINQRLALGRASVKDLEKYPYKDWVQFKKHLKV